MPRMLPHAFDTLVGGLSAGTVVLFSRRENYHVEPLDPDDYDLRLCPSLMSRVVVCKAKIGEHRILFLAVYGYHRDELSEKNVALFHAVTLLNNIVGLPMILGGDLNLTREEIIESGYCVIDL